MATHGEISNRIIRGRREDETDDSKKAGGDQDGSKKVTELENKN